MKGAAEAEALREKIEQTQAAINRLIEAQKRQPGNYEAAIKGHAAALVELEQKLKAAEKAAGGLAGGARNNGRALMEFSRAAEDAQYGIAGVLNNIPGLITALGGSAGLVGVISLAAVAIAQLFKHWEDISAIWGEGHTKTQAEEMEELRKKTELTAIEAERLARAQAVPDAVKDLRSQKTEEQKKTDEGANKAIVEAGGVDELARTLVSVNPNLVDSSPKVGKAQQEVDKAKRNLQIQEDLAAHGEGSGNVEGAKAGLVEAQKNLLDQRHEAAAEQISTAGISKFYPGGLPALIKDVEKDPAKFAGGDAVKGKKLLEGLKAATPEGRQKADEDKEEAYYAEQEREHAFKKYEFERAGDEARKKDEDKEEEYYRKQEEDHANAQEKFRQEGVEAARKKSVKDFDKAMELQPGEGTAIQQELLARQGSGQSSDAAGKAISERLAKVYQEKFGLTEADAKEKADERVHDQQKDLQKELLKPEEKRSSETVGIREYIDKIQASVTNEDIPKDQLGVLENILQEIQRNPEARARLQATYS